MNDPPSSANGPGALVAGKYEVLRLIGRGGMGSVWEGRHTSLGTRVAIKFVDAEHADNEEARSRFVTEARAAAAIRSKHAIQIYDHGLTDDGRPYIVMELLFGEPLDVRIERQGRLSLAETGRILGQVCRALARAHETGIIHRDLKPENIFLVRSIDDDDDEMAKVLDFGIAKIRIPFEGSEPTSSTQTGAVLGTPYYMSPEQARGLPTLDHRTDLWSLGVIAYKCVTGVLPFEGRSMGDLLVTICTGPVPVPSRHAPDVPASFDEWFVRAVDRDPDRRFVNAMELADALAAAAGTSLRRAAISTTETPLPSPAFATPSANEEPPRSASAGRTALAAANNTSAPFTSSAAPTKSSRGVIASAVLAVLVGGSAGVVAVAKLVPRPPPRAATRGPSATAVLTSTNDLDGAPYAAPATAASEAQAATAKVEPVAPSNPAITALSATAANRASAPTVRSASPLVHAADKPPAPSKTAAPSPVHPSPRALSSADPGY